MVEEATEKFWKCPYCSTRYDSYEKAKDCASECVDVDDPEEDEDYTYICEMCTKSFTNVDDAEECEKVHTEKQDKHWELWGELSRKKKLAEAAANPYQSKIKNFI